MDAPLTITQQELLSLAPDISSQAQEIINSCRVTHKDNSSAQNILCFADSSSTNILIASVFAISTSNQLQEILSFWTWMDHITNCLYQ